MEKTIKRLEDIIEKKQKAINDAHTLFNRYFKEKELLTVYPLVGWDLFCKQKEIDSFFRGGMRALSENIE